MPASSRPGLLQGSLALTLPLSWVLACLVGCAAAPTRPDPDVTGDTHGATHAQAALERPPDLTVAQARAKLRALSPNAVQLWVVVHVRAHKTLGADGRPDEARLIEGALADADAVVKGGADALVLINSRCELPLYERVIAAVRARHPDFPLVLSALSYGPTNLTEGFRLARTFHAQGVWCEVVPGEHVEYEADEGGYREAEITPRALALEVQARERPQALHVAGVHMKYTRPLDGRSFEDALRAALGSVDGINITGPKTAVLADVERIRTARAIVGEWPLGLASGVSVDNVAEVAPYVDYLIVGTSLKKDGDPLRTDEAKVRALRAKLDALGKGRAAHAQ